MAIVNQILDKAGTGVVKRQEINDVCDKLVREQLIEQMKYAGSLGWDESRLSFAAEIGSDVDQETMKSVYKTKADFLKIFK
jgi:hypothetical protein